MVDFCLEAKPPRDLYELNPALRVMRPENLERILDILFIDIVGKKGLQIPSIQWALGRKQRSLDDVLDLFRITHADFAFT